MAQTTDMAAEKARKQKIILIVAAVMLAGLAAFQLPKILGGSSSTPAAAPTEEGVVDPATGVAGDLTGTTGTTGGTGAAVVVGKPAGFVAGVPLPSTSRAKVSTGQLASFTLFESKDPFVQQVSEETASTSPSEEQGATASNGRTVRRSGRRQAGRRAQRRRIRAPSRVSRRRAGTRAGARLPAPGRRTPEQAEPLSRRASPTRTRR